VVKRLYNNRRRFLCGPCRGRAVTSGAIRCNKGTPIVEKSPTPPFLSKEEQREKGKTRSIDIEQIYRHGSQRGLDDGSDRAGWLPAVSYCSALLCSAQELEVSLQRINM
jgi:hypothetical protein